MHGIFCLVCASFGRWFACLWCSCILFLFLLRLIVKVTFDYFVVSVGQVIPVLIYGAKTASVSIGKMLHSTTESKYKLIGFIDDSKSANKMQILGCPVYLRNDERKLKEVFKKKQIRCHILTLENERY